MAFHKTGVPEQQLQTFELKRAEKEKEDVKTQDQSPKPKESGTNH